MTRTILILALTFTLLSFGPGQVYGQSLISDHRTEMSAPTVTQFSTSGASTIDARRSAPAKNLKPEIFKSYSDTTSPVKPPPFPNSRSQSQHRNNWSTTATIVVAAAVTIAVIGIVIIAKRCRNEFGC